MDRGVEISRVGSGKDMTLQTRVHAIYSEFRDAESIFFNGKFLIFFFKFSKHRLRVQSLEMPQQEGSNYIVPKIFVWDQK